MSITTRLIAGFLLATLSLTALAHPDPVPHGHGFSLWAGLTHPLTGWVLGSLAVALAARLASRWLANAGRGSVARPAPKEG